jgi:hypothetical protein
MCGHTDEEHRVRNGQPKECEIEGCDCFYFESGDDPDEDKEEVDG